MRTVYTCITGNYDKLLPQPAFPETQYVCFTDTDVRNPGVWEVRPLCSPENVTAPNLQNRYHKINLHLLPIERADEVLYIDGNIQLKSDPKIIFDAMRDQNKSIGMYRHMLRDTARQEMKACFEQNKFDATELMQAESMIASFEAAGFEMERGLTVNSLIFRLEPIRLSAAMETWWQIVENSCKRDQLSLQYVLWKHHVEAMLVDNIMRKRKLFKRTPHTLGVSRGRRFLEKKMFRKLHQIIRVK